LDQGVLETLHHPKDQMVRKSEIRKAEYWRGYREGVRFRFRDKTREFHRDHFRLYEVPDRNDGDPYVDAYARGYRDGCVGKNPEDTPDAEPTP